MSVTKLGKVGFEIELMAPPGKTREDLALAVAARLGGKVRRFFHPQGEPSKVPNTPVFENLTLGFLVEDDQGIVLAQCVDDLTLQDHLNQAQPPLPGWYRIVSDDARLLRLSMRYMDALEPLETVLNPLASLFGSTPQLGEGGMYRVGDELGEPIAMGAPLPGERERPCELVSAPITENHQEQLEDLLIPARELGFTIPAEGAIHIHFDATPLCSAITFANLVRFLALYSDALRERFQTNPKCRRLGRWPVEIFEIITADDFLELTWEVAKERLTTIKLTKFCDFNLFNMVHSVPGKNTFEVRIFPVWMESEKIIEAATFFTGILDWAQAHDGKLKPVPEEFEGMRGMNSA